MKMNNMWFAPVVLGAFVGVGGCGAPEETVEDLAEAITSSDLAARVFCPRPITSACTATAAAVTVTQGYDVYASINPTPDHHHSGIDFGGSRAVYAPVNGTVDVGACGRVTIIDDRPASTFTGTTTSPRHVLMHMASILVTTGQRVTAGTRLGTSSNVSSGACVATGAHLHYEVRRSYAGVLAVGPTSCSGCRVTTLTFNPLAFTYP